MLECNRQYKFNVDLRKLLGLNIDKLAMKISKQLKIS